MNPEAFLLSVCWPFALACGLLASRLRDAARPLAPWAALPALLVPVFTTAEFELGWVMLGGRFGLDAIARVLLPATAGLWLAAGLFAQHHLPAGRARDRFFVWFLVAMSGNLLLLVALDAMVFYLGFAIMSFASYGLVVHEGHARARHAGRYYITLVVVGEVCVVSALMLLASQAPLDFASLRAAYLHDAASHRDLITGLLLAGFGIKAGVVGLHFWLPLAHPVAPAPASAVLSGAMIKAGLVAWMRLLPLGELAMPGWGTTLAVLGLLTAYYGVFAGLGQREAKTVLAYSSVSQMGVMTLAIGLGLAFPEHWPPLAAAVLIYMLHHCLVKGGLFLGAGLVQHSLGPRSARLAAVVLSLGALALAGGPFTGGLVAKLALKDAAGLLPGPWAGSLPPLLSLSSMLTALLMLRFLWIAWPRGGPRAGPLVVSLVAPWLLLCAAWHAAPWLLAAPVLRAAALGPGAGWTAAWPILLALVLAAAAVRMRWQAHVPALPPVPAGDLGIPLERGLLRLGRWLGRMSNDEVPRMLGGIKGLAAAAVRRGPLWSGRLGHAEERISAWSATALLLLFLAASFAWLLK